MTDIFPILSVLRILDRIGCHYHHDLRDGTQRSIFNVVRVGAAFLLQLHR